MNKATVSPDKFIPKHNNKLFSKVISGFAAHKNCERPVSLHVTSDMGMWVLNVNCLYVFNVSSFCDVITTEDMRHDMRLKRLL